MIPATNKARDVSLDLAFLTGRCPRPSVMPACPTQVPGAREVYGHSPRKDPSIMC